MTIAAHFQQLALTLLAKLFFDQAEEERQHAQKFIKYLLDTKGDLEIPAIPAPTATFASAEEAVEAALSWEKEVTKQITDAHGSGRQAERLPRAEFPAVVHRRAARRGRQDGSPRGVIKQSGEKNLLMVEAYLVHIEKVG